MGCGQSKNSRRSKHSAKGNGAKKSGAVDNEADEEEDSTGEAAPEEPVEEPDSPQHVLPIADHQPAFEVSMSQQNFLKMLDEKIEQGKDYDPTSETEIESEEERKRALIEYWRSMSLSPKTSPHSSPPEPVPSRFTRSVSKASERQCAPSTSRQSLRHDAAPARRSHGSQTYDSRPTEWETTKSPLQRTHSSGATRKHGSKVAPLPKKERKVEPVAGCSKDSQVKYNPTFQKRSPTHQSDPLLEQISHPLQTSPSRAEDVEPRKEHQDSKGCHVTVAHVTSETKTFYIHDVGVNPDVEKQRQEAARRLQECVLMKQEQKRLLTAFLQRSTSSQSGAPRMSEGEELAAQYGHPGPRCRSAPVHSPLDIGHLGAPLCSPLAPVSGAWQVPPEMQYYPQSQFMSMFRPAAASDRVQSLSVVRSKPAGQVVAVGANELAVATDAQSAAGTDTAGVSPDTAVPQSPMAAAAPETVGRKTKKKKTTKTIKLSKSLDC